ncbi:hypothetical protein [Sphingomonas sp.]|nr:hypothetical protein [Sphingomonas sp.]
MAQPDQCRSAELFFFSNRIGCGTSLLISAVGTFLLLLALGVIRL